MPIGLVPSSAPEEASILSRGLLLGDLPDLLELHVLFKNEICLSERRFGKLTAARTQDCVARRNRMVASFQIHEALHIVLSVFS